MENGLSLYCLCISSYNSIVASLKNRYELASFGMTPWNPWNRNPLLVDSPSITRGSLPLNKSIRIRSKEIVSLCKKSDWNHFLSNRSYLIIEVVKEYCIDTEF